MLITIITNQYGDGEIAVAAVRGALSDEQKVGLGKLVMANTIAQGVDAQTDECLSFAVVEVLEDPERVAGRILNAGSNGFLQSIDPDNLLPN